MNTDQTFLIVRVNGIGNEIEDAFGFVGRMDMLSWDEGC